MKTTSTTLSKIIDLQDGNETAPRFRIFLWGSSAVPESNFSIDLTNSPRRFDDDIILSMPDGLSNLEFLHIELFGWDEEK